MKKLTEFPQSIKTPRLVLNVILPTVENAKLGLAVIEQNRDYLEAWQGHFGALRTVEDVKKKLEHRYEQITNNEGVLFGIYKDNNLIGRIRFFDAHDNGCEIGYWLIKTENGHGYMSEALSALEVASIAVALGEIIGVPLLALTILAVSPDSAPPTMPMTPSLSTSLLKAFSFKAMI